MDATLPSGIKVSTYSPPRDFNPLTADNADLQKAGFPPRPSDPHHLARYNRVLGSLQGKLNYITPTLRHNADTFHGPRRRLAAAGAAAGTETSTNWSGGVVYAPSGESFRWLEGDWVIPAVDAPTENQWYYCASWIGIDGDGSGDVCQIGIETAAYRSGNTVVTSIYPWWEWYPEAEVAITNFPVAPGDMVTALLCTQGAGSTSATAYFTNRTNGATTSLTFTAPTGTSLVGNSAEWIVEAPTVGGAQSAVADYGEVFFSVCEAVAYNANATQSTVVGGGTGDNINLEVGGNVVSEGILITPTIIQCEYVGPLP